MKRALIVSGGWEGHKPLAFSERFAEWLRAKKFDVEISNDLEILANKEYMRGLDLIVPNWTMGGLPPASTRGLLWAVQNGTGCAGWHGGMGDAFRSNTDYQFMVGGQYVANPGNIKKYTVTPIPGHAITDGLKPFEMYSEQFYMHVDPSNRILATSVFSDQPATWINGVVMPVAWTRNYGRGRIFYCSLGHNTEDFENTPARELTVRGLAWAARP